MAVTISRPGDYEYEYLPIHGPGDYEYWPRTNHPLDPRNDADDYPEEDEDDDSETV